MRPGDAAVVILRPFRLTNIKTRRLTADYGPVEPLGETIMRKHSTAHRRDKRALWVALVLLLACWFAVPRSYSQDRLGATRYKSGPAIRRAFRDLIDESQPGIVEIYREDKLVALGAVMNPEGDILTKASELKGEVQCKLHDGRRLPAELIATHRDTDLALLKVEAENLSEIEWERSLRPDVGQWFVTPGLKELPLSVGIVSVADRTIPPDRAVLGISIADEDKGPRITKVYDESGADKAGLKVGDIVTRVADQVVKTGRSLSSRIGKMRPGDSLKLDILRDEKEMEIRATLGYPQKEMSVFQSRGNFQNRLGGKLSTRRGGFKSIVQHDSILAPNECGGPVIGLTGKALGLNIARGGRTESYALPAQTVIATYEHLKADYLASQKTEAE